MTQDPTRYQRALYDDSQRAWSPIDGDTASTIGECVQACLTASESLPDTGILVLDTTLDDWVAHVLPSPDDPAAPMVAYNPEHVRVTRISGNN